MKVTRKQLGRIVRSLVNEVNTSPASPDGTELHARLEDLGHSPTIRMRNDGTAVYTIRSVGDEEFSIEDAENHESDESFVRIKGIGERLGFSLGAAGLSGGQPRFSPSFGRNQPFPYKIETDLGVVKLSRYRDQSGGMQSPFIGYQLVLIPNKAGAAAVASDNLQETKLKITKRRVKEIIAEEMRSLSGFGSANPDAAQDD